MSSYTIKYTDHIRLTKEALADRHTVRALNHIAPAIAIAQRRIDDGQGWLWVMRRNFAKGLGVSL